MISFDGYTAPDDDSLVMSNGGTDVFISIPALSGAGIARTESEKRLMVFLSERDQIIGGGCVGFETVEMPYDRRPFEADKRFLMQVIQGARNRSGWERLDEEDPVFCHFPRCQKHHTFLTCFGCQICHH